MKEDDCYLCGTPMKSSYFKFVKINKERLVIEICPECYQIFKYGSKSEKQDYILKKHINLKGIRL